MSLVPIFKAVKAGLETILKANTEEIPVHLLGEEHLPNPGELPRIVWVPKGAGKIVSKGAMRGPTTVSGSPSIRKAREYVVHEETVHAYIGAKDREATWRLMNHFIATARVALTAFSFKPLATSWSIGWPTPTQEPTAEVKSGTLCILAFEVNVPFTFEPEPIATLTTATVTGQIVESFS